MPGTVSEGKGIVDGDCNDSRGRSLLFRILVQKIRDAIVFYFKLLFLPQRIARTLNFSTPAVASDLWCAVSHFLQVCGWSGVIWFTVTDYFNIQAYYMQASFVSRSLAEKLFTVAVGAAPVILGLLIFAALRTLPSVRMTFDRYVHCFAYPAAAAVILLVLFLLVATSYLAYLSFDPIEYKPQITTFSELLLENTIPEACVEIELIECQMWLINKRMGGSLQYLAWGAAFGCLLVFAVLLAVFLYHGGLAPQLTIVAAAAVAVGFYLWAFQVRDIVSDIIPTMKESLEFGRARRALLSNRNDDAIRHLTPLLGSKKVTDRDKDARTAINARPARSQMQTYSEGQRMKLIAVAHAFRGWAYFNKKQYTDAIEDFRLSVWMGDKIPTGDLSWRRFRSMHRLNLGLAYIEDRQYRKAKRELKEAARIHGEYGLLERAECASIIGLASIENVRDGRFEDLARSRGVRPSSEPTRILSAVEAVTSERSKKGGSRARTAEIEAKSSERPSPADPNPEEPGQVFIMSCLQEIELARKSKEVTKKFLEGMSFLIKRSGPGEGRYYEAVKKFDSVISDDSEFDLAYRYRGWAYARLGSYKDARTDYDTAIDLRPRYAQLYGDRADFLVKHGPRNQRRYDLAYDDYNKAVILDPEEPRFYMGRGRIYALKGDALKAVADFDKAIDLDSTQADAYLARGISYFYDWLPSNSGRALKDFDEAIRLGVQTSSIHIDRGNVYFAMKNWERARADYDQAVVLRQDSYVAFRNRGLVFSRLGKHREAIDDYDRAIAVKADYADAFNSRGFAYEKLGERDKAIADYREALKHDPNHELARSNLKSLGVAP